MIIFGFSVFFFGALSEGVFHCPRCGGDRQYKHKAGRRWFTLFFVPVIPLDKVGEIVRCETCHTRYDPEVLTIPTAERMAEVVQAAMRAAAAAVLSAADPAETAAREQALRHAGSVLAPQGRERIVAEATRAALTTGALTDDQRSILGGIGQMLGLTPAQTYGVVALAEQGAQRE